MLNSRNSKFRAVASIVIDDSIALHDIKIIEGRDGAFITMPSKRIPNGEWKDTVHPINSQTREMMNDTIIDAYMRTLAEGAEA